jgi:Ser/Thr protein kinase RdoA (MazF antagonist)
MPSDEQARRKPWPEELLFRPDLFSRPAPAPLTAPPEWQALHIEPLARRYESSIGRLLKAETFGAPPAPGRLANGITCRLLCEAGVFVLKIVMNPDVLRDLDRQLATMRAIVANTDLSPDVISPDAGDLAVQIADGTAAYLMSCFEGHSFAATPAETISAGRRLPEFLKAASQVPENVRPRRQRNPYFTEIEEAGLVQLRAERKNWPSAFGAETAVFMEKYWPEFEHELSLLRPFGERLNTQELAFGHFDLHPHNLVSRDGALVGVIDLDACFRAPASLFPAFALLKLLKQLFVRVRSGETDLATAENAAALFRRDIYAYAAKLGISPNELADTAKLEAMRRFLSVCRFGLEGREIPWNGPIVHFAAIAEADRLFIPP